MSPQKEVKGKATRRRIRRNLSPEQEDILRDDEEQRRSLLVRGVPFSLPLVKVVVRDYLEKIRKKRISDSD